MKSSLHATLGKVIAMVFLFGVGCGKGAPPNEKTSSEAPSAKPTEKSEGPAAAPPLISVTSMEFVQDCTKDPKAADAKYKGKIVEVSGLLTGISRNVSKEAQLILNGPNKEFAICYTIDQAPWKRYSPGQQVTLRGKWTGFRGNAALLDCTVTKASEDPTLKVTAEDLATQYTADPSATSKKYKNRWLVITGQVLAVGAKDANIELKGDGKTRITCNSLEDDLWKPMKVGNKVRLLGELRYDLENELTISDFLPRDLE